MRFFIFVFSIYITCLALMPCMDAYTCEDHDSENIEAHDYHDHEGDKADLCTPFCTCACCGSSGFTVMSHTVSVPVSFTSLTTFMVPTYKKSFTSSYYFSFWQPPKIS